MGNKGDKYIVHIPVKPMSVNSAWQGRRFKSEDYLRYIPEVIAKAEEIETFAETYVKEALGGAKLKIYYIFGVSNPLMDYDNPIKPLQDILFKQLGIDDHQVYEAEIQKVIVPKGSEYSRVQIEII